MYKLLQACHISLFCVRARFAHQLALLSEATAGAVAHLLQPGADRDGLVQELLRPGVARMILQTNQHLGDLIERIIALRCSKARPIVLCTINKPTAKLSKPNADKFK